MMVVTGWLRMLPNLGMASLPVQFQPRLLRDRRHFRRGGDLHVVFLECIQGELNVGKFMIEVIGNHSNQMGICLGLSKDALRGLEDTESIRADRNASARS